MDRSEEREPGRALRYRIVIRGPMAADWAGWFGADLLAPEGENSVLEVEVADQAELYGRLRRIHDLHLTLISLQVIDTSAVTEDPFPCPDPSNKPTRSNPHE